MYYYDAEYKPCDIIKKIKTVFYENDLWISKLEYFHFKRIFIFKTIKTHLFSAEWNDIECEFSI